MSLASCQKCWETPCRCGWDYRNWPREEVQKQVTLLMKTLRYTKVHPTAVFSSIGEPENNDDKKFMEFMNEKQ